MRYPRNMLGYGKSPPDPKWPGGAHVAVEPQGSLEASTALDWVAGGEFDFTVKEVAEGRPRATIDGLSHRVRGEVVHNRPRGILENMDLLPHVVPQAVAFAGRLGPRSLEGVGFVEPVDFPPCLENLQGLSEHGAGPPFDERLESGARGPAEHALLAGRTSCVRQEGFCPRVCPAQLVVALESEQRLQL